MTIRSPDGARAAAAPGLRSDASTSAECQRHAARARFWRMTLGALGLFWVCVLLLLMG